MDPQRRADVLTIDTVHDYLKEAFIRFYETAYELRDASVSEERRALLQAPGVVFAEPFLELMAEYPAAARTMQETFDDLGVPEAATLVSAGLMPHEHAYEHQDRALRDAMGGKDVVVATGTGSGKTESFLLPVLTRLVQESRSWPARSSLGDNRWWEGGGDFTPQRDGESGRPSAIRAMLLYPMNALVEDQLVRLRAALDSPAARAWLDQHRPGHRFYFGRYTGRTPVSGTQGSANPSKIKRLRTLMRDGERRQRNLLTRTESDPSLDRLRYFLPALDGAEMRSRWDMQHSTPDIFITNYSMLAIALQRDDERSMIDATRRWLEQSEDNVFTLVVDELHTYRGTAGTEVAHLLRRLVLALGLHQRPDQLQVIGTSASVHDDAQGRQFLSEFFARPPERTFSFVTAPQEVPEGSDDLDHLTSQLASPDSVATSLPIDGSVPRALSLAMAVDDAPRPREFAEVARRVFPNAEPAAGRSALDRLVGLMGQQEKPSARLRAHLFARTLQGLWACSDPACAAAARGLADEDRRVGKLYTSSRFTCECGARVLELLYCQSCGETMLGGHQVVSDARCYLVSSSADLDEAPERSVISRNAHTYRVYWPTSRQRVVDPWARTGTKRSGDTKKPRYEMSFARASYSPGTGDMAVGRKAQTGPTGFLYEVKSPGGGDVVGRMPAFPTRCPACGDDWEWTLKGAVEDPARSRSPIRTQGVGFDRANQVLTGALRRRLGSNLVTFSDSRQGAARVAASLELAHYLDLVRSLVVEVLEGSSSDWALIESFINKDRAPEAQEAFSRFQSSHPDAAMAALSSIAGMAMTPVQQEAFDLARRDLEGRPTLTRLGEAVEPRLLSIGVNPAGPRASLQEKKERPWKDLFRWEAEEVRDRGSALDADSKKFLDEIRGELNRQVVRTVFAGGDRDVESLGLAHAVPDAAAHLAGLSDEVAEQVSCSVLRLLGSSRRFVSEEARDKWPGKVRRYANAVAEKHGLVLEGAEIVDAVAGAIGAGSASGYRLDPSRVRVAHPRSSQVWRCQTCRAKHLHPSAGTCTACFRPLPSAPEALASQERDYYGWLTEQREGIARLHCEELTGQTDVVDAQARQAQFQDVFLDGQDQPRVDGIDILSVTTTMEAGVDIGALQGVVMANMPPQRFNYQQRVGRAGRRSEHLSLALTIARGARSHDEHYFAHPGAITGDMPPQPFLDTRSLPILRRAMAAEVLTKVFREVADTPDFDPGRSVHGQLGAVEGWRENALLRQKVHRLLSERASEWSGIADALVIGTRADHGTAQDLARWAAQDLADQVDAVAGRAKVFDLSEALAQEGVLPMFGFPTQVRSLFTKHPLREPSTLERQADVAVSEFAPGSEVVKDKAVHTAVGIVDFRRRSDGGWTEGSSPWRAEYSAGVCRTCFGITEEQSASCPTCGAGEPDFSWVDVVEPAGYRTSFKTRDYEQLGESAARASQPRLSMVTGERALRGTNALVRSGNAEIHTINDNGGSLYRFVEVADTWKGQSQHRPGLVDHDLLDDQDRAGMAGLSFLHATSTPSAGVALAARRRTDVLVIGAHRFPAHLSAALDDPAGRGAWASFGFLVRAAATRWLDIGPDEIQVGIHPRASDGVLSGEVFLADSLENGAGYATHLGANIEDLLSLTFQQVAAAEQHAGGLPCDSSCYSCLRDYSNRPWHSLLDWRLGADLLDIMEGKDLVLERARERDFAAARAFAKDFGFDVLEEDVPVIVGKHGARTGVFHPFERADDSDVAPRVHAARVRHGDSVGCCTSFDLVRRPGTLVGHLMKR